MTEAATEAATEAPPRGAAAVSLGDDAQMIPAHDDSESPVGTRLSTMNAIQPQTTQTAWHHLAATTPAAPGHNISIGFILLVILVLGALTFGVVRLNRRRLAAGRKDGSIAPPGPAQPAAAPAPPPARSAPVSFQRPKGGWAVETHGLTKRFGTNVAVDEVELLVPRGSAFGYLGPNGAGKTTLIRTLLGLTRADQGRMSLLGTPVPAQRSRALARVGAIVDEPRFHPHLTGQENLRLLAAARGGDAATRTRGSRRRWPGSASPSAPMTRSPRSRWACASASGWPRACSATRSC